eukprot:6207151-Pleurochrysis_carterae.AAC.1
MLKHQDNESMTAMQQRAKTENRLPTFCRAVSAPCSNRIFTVRACPPSAARSSGAAPSSFRSASTAAPSRSSAATAAASPAAAAACSPTSAMFGSLGRHGHHHGLIVEALISMST